MLWIRWCWQAAVPVTWGLCSWFTSVPMTPCCPCTWPTFLIHDACLIPVGIWDCGILAHSSLISNAWGVYHYHSQLTDADKFKEMVTCPRSHSQRVSEPGFKHKPTYSQSQPSLFFAEVPSRAHRLNESLQAETRKENQCQSLTLGKKYKKRECSSLLSDLIESPIRIFLRTKGCFQWLIALTVQDPYQWKHRTYILFCDHHKKGFHIQFVVSVSFFRSHRKARGREGCGWQRPHTRSPPSGWQCRGPTVLSATVKRQLPPPQIKQALWLGGVQQERFHFMSFSRADSLDSSF